MLFSFHPIILWLLLYSQLRNLAQVRDAKPSSLPWLQPCTQLKQGISQAVDGHKRSRHRCFALNIHQERFPFGQDQPPLRAGYASHFTALPIQATYHRIISACREPRWQRRSSPEAATLMLQAQPNLTPDTIKARLMLSADKWCSRMVRWTPVHSELVTSTFLRLCNAQFSPISTQ